MKLKYKKIGDYIRPVNNRNKDLLIKEVFGINLSKNFMPSIANTKDVNLSVYKIVERGQFGCKLMSVGRDNRLPIGYLKQEKSVIISPAYHVFEVIDKNILLPDYLFMWLSRSENDRWLGFASAGDVRGGITWEEFCNIEIPIPEDIKIQKNVVVAYSELLKNQSCFENSLNDLQFICDSFMENLAKKGDLKELRKYVERINDKNTDKNIKDVMGLSVKKEFRVPKVTVNREELGNYKIVRNNQFAFVQTTNNEKVLVCAVSKFSYPIVVSSVNEVFKIVDETILLPDFLFLWFKRPDFDRYARFHSWGSARETFNWEDMCSVRLPIPNIEIQRSIVAIHHILESRKRINENLKNMVTSVCPILMKGVINNLSIN